jgi:hypothetical protein
LSDFPIELLLIGLIIMILETLCIAFGAEIKAVEMKDVIMTVILLS